jgi:hypothetical protein
MTDEKMQGRGRKYTITYYSFLGRMHDRKQQDSRPVGHITHALFIVKLIFWTSIIYDHVGL